MSNAIQVLPESDLMAIAGGQSKIICTVSADYITCVQGGVTIRMPRTDTNRGNRGTPSTGGGTGGGKGGGDNSGGSGRRR